MAVSTGVRFLHGVSKLPGRVLVGLVRFYRYFLRPWLGSRCRYDPTCSDYAMQALHQQGAAAGTLLAMARVLRCHPWCEGGHDPVPAAGAPLFKHLLGRVTSAEPAFASVPESVPESAAGRACLSVPTAPTSTSP